MGKTYNVIEMKYGDEYSFALDTLQEFLSTIDFYKFKIEIINRIYGKELMYVIKINNPNEIKNTYAYDIHNPLDFG
jgi:hypothetical protein